LTAPRQRGIVEVLPELPILAEVDHDSGLLTPLIHHELHAFHDFTSTMTADDALAANGPA